MSQLNTRLRFIDVGRSIAIIMMLQGHFISRTLVDYKERLADRGNEDSIGDFVFNIWFLLRALTARLFFTITGVVFVYLLLGGKNTVSYFKQIRVRKGLKRALTVILIGYILQTNYQNLDYYLAGKINQRFFGFHVLQSIGTGILALLILYGTFLLFKLKRFSVVLLISGFLVLIFTPFIEFYGDTYLPRNAHAIIQNVVHGPNSFFPIFPWLGFVLLGGAIGAVLREFSTSVRQSSFPFKFFMAFLGVGVLFFCVVKMIGFFVDDEIKTGGAIYRFYQFALVVLLITILMYFERFSKGKDSTFIKMGQNTLEIYVLHVIILYGAITGIGLTRWFEHKLTLGQSVFGALIFVLLFAVFAKYWGPFKIFLGRIKQQIKAPFVRSK